MREPKQGEVACGVYGNGRGHLGRSAKHQRHNTLSLPYKKGKCWWFEGEWGEDEDYL